MDGLEPGSIIHIENYLFPDGSSKNKYVIVLHVYEDLVHILYTLPSSQIRNTQSKTNHGCINNSYFSHYTFVAERVIGKNGFKFPKDTFVYFRDNIRSSQIADFSKYIDNNMLEIKDVLTSEEYDRLIKCCTKSNLIARKHKKIFEEIRNRL